MMAVPALKEPPLEERVARIESHVEHIQSDLTDVKIDLRETRREISAVEQRLLTDGVDQKLSAKIDGVDQKLSAKIDGLDQRVSDKFDRSVRWAVGVAILLLGAMGAGYSALNASIWSLASRQDKMFEELTSSQAAMARDFSARLDATAQQFSARQDKMADQLQAITAALGRLERAGKQAGK